MSFGTAQKLTALIESRDALASEIVEAKLHMDKINQEIAAIAAPTSDAAYKKADKVDGTVTFAIEGEVYKSAIDKRVKWDSDALQSISGSLSFEDAQRLFKVEFSMSETVFKGVTDPELKAKLIAARTVIYGEPKITKP